jgi:hypothetical protein
VIGNSILKELKMVVFLKNARLAFANGLFEAKSINGSKPSFGVALLINKEDTDQIKTIRGAMKAAATEKWKLDADKNFNVLEKTDRLALHDGDTKPDYDGYPECFFINARSKFGPNTKMGFIVLDRNKNRIGAEEGIIYSGCYVNAKIQLWAQDRKDEAGKRINATLLGIQFVADGDSFSGTSAASENDFPDLADTGEDNLLNS